MELKDLKLDFLWERNPYIVLDAPNPYWEKWSGDKTKLWDYFDSCSLEQLIEQMIYTTKDKYARKYYWGFSDGTKEALKNYYKEGEYECLDNKYLQRKELKRVLDKTIDHPKNGATFLKEVVFEFMDNQNLIPIIEQTLATNTYAKNVISDKTIYTLSNSPIETIETSPTMFRMIFNEDSWKSLGIDG